MSQSTNLQVKNGTSSSLVAGKAVYISGFDEELGLPIVSLADNRYESTGPVIGLVKDVISGNGLGAVKTVGLMTGLDTSSQPINAKVFVGVNGGLIFSDPSSASLEIATQQIGVVTKSDASPNGQIYLFPFAMKNIIPEIQQRKNTGFQEDIESLQTDVDLLEQEVDNLNDGLNRLQTVSLQTGDIFYSYLSSGQIAIQFDGTGLGQGTRTGQAICNGNNGTPNLDGLYIKSQVSGFGAAAGSSTTDGSSAANTGGSGTLTTNGPVGITTSLSEVGGTVKAASSSHTHTLDSHTHTMAHTHTFDPPNYSLVPIMVL